MKFFYLPYVILLILGWAPMQAQDGIFDSTTGEEIVNFDSTMMPPSFDFFDSEEPLDLILETDFKRLIKDKYKDQYQSGFLKYPFYGDMVIQKEIQVKIRGEFRKKYCLFPPIKLNFKDTEFRYANLQALKSLKLVTNCRFSKSYEQYILKEYLAYRLLNILTERSFKVRLVRMRYEDTSGRYDPATRFAFLIEEAKTMSKRQNALLYKLEKLHPDRTQQQHMILVDLFQYMIGNTDWSVPGLHNLKLIKVQDLQEPDPYAIPYDFDYSGIVNASYATPSDKLSIESVTERLYWGYCPSQEDLRYAIEAFQKNEQQLLDLFQNDPYITDRTKKESVAYLKQFFEIINNPARVKKEILGTCRK